MAAAVSFRDVAGTPYGDGIVLRHRDHDGVYEIGLEYGRLYMSVSSCSAAGGSSETDGNHVQNTSALVRPVDVDRERSDDLKRRKQTEALELNVAYEALENMRQLNFEATCREKGIHDADLHCWCSACVLENAPTATNLRDVPRGRFEGFRHFLKKQTLPNIYKKGDPCLICGSPCCSGHSSASFRADGIIICDECEKVVSTNFITHCLSTDSNQNRENRINRIIDLYDRTLILLRYSSQFIDEIASQLEQSKDQQNKVAASSSSVGMVSGALGVAAAAAIYTPAGIPLLVASLLLGGSATAFQAGTEVRSILSGPNQLADRILALHGMARSILRIISIVRDGLSKTDEQRDTACGDEEENIGETFVDKKEQRNRRHIMTGIEIGRYSAVGVEIGAVTAAGATAEKGAIVASRSARMISRTASNLFKAMRVARFTGGALSAACFCLEASCLADTLKSIREGSPCEKAQLLRLVTDDLQEMPPTSSVHRECENDLRHLKRSITQEAVARLLMKHFDEQELGDKIPTGCEQDEGDTTPNDEYVELQYPAGFVDTICSSLSVPNVFEVSESAAPTSSSSSSGDDERDEIGYGRTSTSLSLLERISMHKRHHQQQQQHQHPSRIA